MPATDDPSADLALLKDAAREAGAIAMRHFRRDPQVWMKDGKSPVSAADFEVDDFLRNVLRAARPDYGWLSEETTDTGERLSARRVFVVDPIDGTRAFIDGRRTWCVSVAVVEDGVTTSGVLECPARHETYEAALNGPALRNGKAIAVAAPRDRPRIAGPNAMVRLLPEHLRSGAALPYVPSLAYRIAMVASGEIDGTLVKPNAHDWDLAAADLILRRAGGGVRGESGAAPLYGGRDTRHGALVAAGNGLLPELQAFMARQFGGQGAI